MSTLDDIAQARQRIADRLARLDAERAKLAEELGDLDAAARVLSRFGEARPGGRRHRGTAPTAEAAAGAPRRGRQRRAARTAERPSSPSLGDATLRAVAAHGHGASADEVRTFLAREFGMQVRPNHLGMALQRHRRGGRLELRDSRWWVVPAIGQAAAATSHP